jgi:hypothetical protein
MDLRNSPSAQDYHIAIGNIDHVRQIGASVRPMAAETPRMKVSGRRNDDTGSFAGPPQDQFSLVTQGFALSDLP